MDVLIKDMKMPSHCTECDFWHDGVFEHCLLNMEVQNEDVPFNEGEYPIGCPLVELPPHGRLIDADALIADLKRQCKEVFRIDAVSPDDFWITRNQAYNERLWTTWCESLYDYINTAPTIIEADGGE